MRKSLETLLILTSLVVFYSQCQEQGSYLMQSEETLIGEAKDFFETKVLNAYQDINTSNPKALLPKILKWEDAYVNKLSIGGALVVPIHYEKSIVITNNLDKDRYYPLDDLTKLLIYKDIKNVYHAELINYFPDIYFKSFDHGFTGIVNVEDWFGNLLKSYKYESDGAAQQLNPTKSQAFNTSMKTLKICYTVFGYNSSAAGETLPWSETHCQTFIPYTNTTTIETTGNDYSGVTE